MAYTKLYTNQEGKWLHESGQGFYASKTPVELPYVNDFDILFVVDSEYLEHNEHTENKYTYSDFLVTSEAEIEWKGEELI